VFVGSPTTIVLDRHLFDGPYILIDRDGEALRRSNRRRSVLVFHSDAEARQALRTVLRAAAIVGTLRHDARGIDVDPADRNAGAVAGDVVAELLARWATERGRPVVVRESGRPGGRHLVVGELDEGLVAELHQYVRELAQQLDVAITTRRSLRLLSSPHREGLPAPVLFSTFEVAESEHVPGRKTSRRQRVTAAERESGSQTCRSGAMSRRPAVLVDAGDDVLDDGQVDAAEHLGEIRTPGLVAAGAAGDQSPSGLEFGRAAWCARQGMSGRQAFVEALPCQVVERGRAEWERFIWSGAVTTVAAERGMDEDQAWRWLVAECPARAEELGRDGWRPWWLAAVEQAADPTVRRRYTKPQSLAAQARDLHGSAGVPVDGPPAARRQAEVELHREALHQVAEELLAGRRPQVHRTMAAVLDAVADVIVAGGGRISVRRLAEVALVAGGTVSARRAELLDAGVLRRVATHKADAQPCDLYALGEVTQQRLDQLRSKTCGRSCTPPRPRSTGTADPVRLRRRHQAQRARYRPPTATSVQTEAITKAYPKGGHGPATVRSRLRQRQWWQGLTAAEQAERRQLMRARMDRMPAVDRERWVIWLAERDLLDQALDRLLDGSADAGDRAAIERAPLTVHHGRQDPLWRTGGTRPSLRSSAAETAAQGMVRAVAVLASGQFELGLELAAAPAVPAARGADPRGTRWLPPPGPLDPGARPAPRPA
jgi:hypothetical protein